MKLEGALQIAAGRQAVWALLADPVALSDCVPGATEVRRVDDRTFGGTIRASVGPIDGAFAFTSRLDSADAPHALGVEVEGTDSVTKSRLTAAIAVALAGPDEGPTALTYAATVGVGGRLAIVGEMILRAAAGVVIAQASQCLRDRLEAAPEASAP